MTAFRGVGGVGLDSGRRANRGRQEQCSAPAWRRGQPGGALVNALEYQQVLGRRVAEGRRRHGMSQPELAALVRRPVSWVSKLERGATRIDSPDTLRTVAHALELPLTELTAGGPSVAGRPRRAGTPADAEGLRVILAGVHSLGAMLGDQDAPSFGWLRARTDRACTLSRAARYAELTSLLADLLPGLEAAVRTFPPAGQPEVYELLAVAYQSCSAALARLGETEAAWIAADRAMDAAERAGNLLLVAAGAHRLASVFLNAGHHALAEETARTTVAALQGLACVGDPDAVALCGGLALLRAVVAARAGRQAAAYGQLTRARQLAARLGAQRAGGAPEFGPEYVALYEIAVSVDLGDAGHALRVAAQADITGLSAGHRARMLIDVARAFALREQREEAIGALLRAESVSAVYVRDSDRAGQLITGLLKRAAGPPPAELTQLAARLAVPRTS
jgi:transcriptional regulator with XRE-family HTH domain